MVSFDAAFTFMCFLDCCMHLKITLGFDPALYPEQSQCDRSSKSLFPDEQKSPLQSLIDYQWWTFMQQEQRTLTLEAEYFQCLSFI